MCSRRRFLDLIIASALSFLFTVALLYATLEVPRVVHALLIKVFPDWGLHFEMEKMRETIESLRPIGYVTFVTVLILIIIGFVFGKTRISSLGSIGLYLPVFGQFAFSMFFLAGIGVLRALWLPILDVSPKILRLGDIVYVPYMILIFLLEHMFRLMGVHLPPTKFEAAPSLIIMLLGLLIFLLGATTWLYGKFRGHRIIDFWIYRFSRHPQYLGFIVWSYGLLILAAITPSPRGDYIPPPSLLWLILTLTLIGSALNEENNLTKKYGEEYARYRAETPFMIPLPKPLINLLTIPVKALFGKNIPEHRREIIGTLLIYGLILALLSTPIALRS